MVRLKYIGMWVLFVGMLLGTGSTPLLYQWLSINGPEWLRASQLQRASDQTTPLFVASVLWCVCGVILTFLAAIRLYHTFVQTMNSEILAQQAREIKYNNREIELITQQRNRAVDNYKETMRRIDG